MLLLGLESDSFADFGEHLWGDAKERGDVLQVEQMNDARTALQQHFVSLAWRCAKEIEVAAFYLPKEVFAYETA